MKWKGPIMTEAEVYEFDLNGYIVYRNLIGDDDLVRMNELIDSHASTDADRFAFLALDPIFLRLMAHPRTLHILKTIIGPWLRHDHAYGIQMTSALETRENLHGGLRADQGEHQYQWAYGKMWNGLTVVMYALEDVNPGDGGFIAVPASHKASLNIFKPDVDSPLVANPSLRAGDMLIFTEALVHGTRRWRSPQRRRSLLYKYSPGYSSWSPPQANDKYLDLATDDLQRDLLRHPFVGGRSPLDFPTPGGDTEF